MGAIRFAPPDVDEAARLNSGGVDWLTGAQLEERIRILVANRSDGRMDTNQGHYTLPGAQTKTALRFDPVRNRWGIPNGSEPTNRFLKPSTPGFDHQVWEEHFCLQLAKAVELDAVNTEVIQLAGHDILLVDLYDRTTDESGSLRRLHQEDACQALGVMPEHKYEAATSARKSRGPGIQELIQLAG